nr:hypothetical protein [Propionibacterium sp.]
MNANATLPGVAGVVGLVNDPLLGHVLTVDGQAVKREKADYLLPGVDGGTVRANLKGRFLAEHPVLVVDGREYTTGAVTSPFLLLISFLPVLFLFTGSLIGLALAILGVVFNLWIVRAPRAEAWKAAVILAAFVVGVVFQLLWAFFSSWVLGLLRR